jgi:ParB-like chromosome segregation protein Spo0J
MAVPNIAPRTTRKISNELLEFDPDNPRLVENGLKHPTDEQVIRALAVNADLQEVVASIASNGYFDIEPLIVQRVKDKYRVLEGNRRLAAIRLLQNPGLGKEIGINVPKVPKAIVDTFDEVTVYAVANAAQARDYIGFKHINGPHRWDALAKARFAAS